MGFQFAGEGFQGVADEPEHFDQFEVGEFFPLVQVQAEHGDGAGDALVVGGEGGGAFDVFLPAGGFAHLPLQGGGRAAVGAFGLPFALDGGAGERLAGGLVRGDDAEVGAVRADGGGDKFGELFPLPAGPEKFGGDEREHAAGEAGEQAADGEIQVHTGGGIGDEHEHEGDKKDGDAVAAFHEVGKAEGHDGGEGEQEGDRQFHPDKQAAEHRAGQGAEDTLAGLFAGGPVVRLQYDDGGKGNPVAAGNLEPQIDGHGQHGEDGHAQGIADEHGIELQGGVHPGTQRTEGEAAEFRKAQGEALVRSAVVHGFGEGGLDLRQQVADLHEHFADGGGFGVARGQGGKAFLKDAHQVGTAAEADFKGDKVIRPVGDGEQRG